MDYVTRQFINLTRKFRKELRDGLSTLHGDSNNLANAVRDQAKANREHNETSKELYQSPLKVDVETWQDENYKRKKESHRKFGVGIQFTLTLGTLGAFIAAAIYAGIACSQLEQMR